MLVYYVTGVFIDSVETIRVNISSEKTNFRLRACLVNFFDSQIYFCGVLMRTLGFTLTLINLRNLLNYQLRWVLSLSLLKTLAYSVDYYWVYRIKDSRVLLKLPNCSKMKFYTIIECIVSFIWSSKLYRLALF